MTTSTDPRIKLAIDGGIAVLTLDRADKLNALDAAMVAALHAACRALEHERDVRAVILTGTGDRAFCVGGDIASWSAESPEDFGRFWVREGHAAFDALARLSQPVIAVLNGATLGGGLELAAAADLRIAEQHAKIGQPESGIGIIAGWSGTQRAVRRFGAQSVRRMALFGEVFTAAEALQLGVVDRVVASGAGMAEATMVAAKLLQRGPQATLSTKMLINAAEGEERERVLEALAGTLAASTEELREGVAAFSEKRKPDFGSRKND
ncbi:MAG: enoyl-CoA hydratase/isomerase family protein [Alphaproteobacteria bacterium]